MCKGVFLDPLEHNMRWLQHSVTLHPAQELWIDLQMLIGVSEHDDACRGCAARNGRTHPIAELHWCSIVIVHGSQRLTRIRRRFVFKGEHFFAYHGEVGRERGVMSLLGPNRHAAGGRIRGGHRRDAFTGVDHKRVVITELGPGAVRYFAEVDEFPIGYVGLVNAQVIADGW